MRKVLVLLIVIVGVVVCRAADRKKEPASTPAVAVNPDALKAIPQKEAISGCRKKAASLRPTF
jgi:hypothetical protein